MKNSIPTPESLGLTRPLPETPEPPVRTTDELLAERIAEYYDSERGRINYDPMFSAGLGLTWVELVGKLSAAGWRHVEVGRSEGYFEPAPVSPREFRMRESLGTPPPAGLGFELGEDELRYVSLFNSVREQGGAGGDTVSVPTPRHPLNWAAIEQHLAGWARTKNGSKQDWTRR